VGRIKSHRGEFSAALATTGGLKIEEGTAIKGKNLVQNDGKNRKLKRPKLSGEGKNNF